VAQLCQHTAAFQAANTRIVLISFGLAYQARAWQAETGACFTLLLDPDRAAYRAYQLEHSLARSWQPKVWLEYARLMLSGSRFAWRGIQGDSAQLGGDFIVDAKGILRLAYRSHDPTDRPTTIRLLQEIEIIERGKPPVKRTV
jgi:alkyl hydroperoxide reductase subunit AhpC